jgi:hypothetical protein
LAIEPHAGVAWFLDMHMHPQPAIDAAIPLIFAEETGEPVPSSYLSDLVHFVILVLSFLQWDIETPASHDPCRHSSQAAMLCRDGTSRWGSVYLVS